MLEPAHEPVPSFRTPYRELQSTPTPTGLASPVSLRTRASVDPTMLRVWDASAVKHNTFPSRPGYASGSAHWQTHLHVEVWVRNATYAKHLWADVHVFAHDGALIASETCSLVYERPAGDGGDLFRVDCAVYEGASASPGSATLRPDVRLVQYRVYAELGGRVFTDGLLHDCLLRSDVVSG